VIYVEFYTADSDSYIGWFQAYFGTTPDYYIYPCSATSLYFTTTPSLTQDDTWTITKTDAGLKIEVNGEEVLNYLFSSSGESQCVDAYNVEVAWIKFSSNEDTASDQYRQGTATATGQSRFCD